MKFNLEEDEVVSPRVPVFFRRYESQSAPSNRLERNVGSENHSDVGVNHGAQNGK